MKNREQKQKDLDALAEQFKAANAAMLVSFNKMTVGKDQEQHLEMTRDIAGSFNPTVWYGPDPKNLSEEFFDLTVDKMFDPDDEESGA